MISHDLSIRAKDLSLKIFRTKDLSLKNEDENMRQTKHFSVRVIYQPYLYKIF